MEHFTQYKNTLHNLQAEFQKEKIFIVVLTIGGGSPIFY